jgi:hypothetical protein
LTDSDVKTFLKTLHREEMEFVIIKGLALGEEIERNGLGLSQRIFPSSGTANICAYSDRNYRRSEFPLDDPQGAK